VARFWDAAVTALLPVLCLYCDSTGGKNDSKVNTVQVTYDTAKSTGIDQLLPGCLDSFCAACRLLTTPLSQPASSAEAIEAAEKQLVDAKEKSPQTSCQAQA